MKPFEVGDKVLYLRPNMNGSYWWSSASVVSELTETGYVTLNSHTFLKFNARTGFNSYYPDYIIHDTPENREEYKNKRLTHFTDVLD